MQEKIDMAAWRYRRGEYEEAQELLAVVEQELAAGEGARAEDASQALPSGRAAATPC